MASDPSRRAGIREIAEALGVSIGTVDRALHGRGGIRASTRQKVLDMARELSYTPNIAAQNLKLARELRIGVFLPAEIASFFGQVREGMRSAEARWSGAPLKLKLHEFPRLGSGDIACMIDANWQAYDGVIVAPGDPEQMSALFRSDNKEVPPVVYVTTDALRTPRLASVAVDSTVSGGIAADLLGRILQVPTSVIAITGDRRVQDHAAKISGFAGTLATQYPHLTLLPSIESHERSEDAYEAAHQLFRKHSDLGGIYVTTADSMPILRAAEEAGALGKTRIVTTDLSQYLATMIENDHVFASLYQRPFTQGSMAVDILCRYLLHKARPESTIRLAPHIVLRSNLPLFLNQLEGDSSFAP